MIRNTTLKFWRDQNGAHTNVPQLAVEHSPTGLSWGYMGSGPSDLALNIIEYTLRRMKATGPRMTTWGGQRVYRETMNLYQQYKAEVVSEIAWEGGEIPLYTVIAWIENKRKGKGA